MPIIKASQSAPLLKEAIVLDLGDLSRQAQALKQAARDEARGIVDAAQAQARKLVEAAHGQGFAQGHAEGLEKGLAEGREQGRREALAQVSEQLAGLQVSWTKALEGWDSRRAELERQARTAVLELALKLAEKVVHRCVEVDPTVAVDQLAAALGHALSPTDVSVSICPADRAVLEAALPALMARFAGLQHVRLVDDVTIAAGGCVLRLGQGRIDATLPTQFRRIVELLLPEGSGAVDADAPSPSRAGCDEPPAPPSEEVQP